MQNNSIQNAKSNVTDALSLIEVIEAVTLSNDYTLAGDSEISGLLMIFDMLKKKLEDAESELCKGQMIAVQSVQAMPQAC